MEVTSCLICGSSLQEPIMKVTDFGVSQEVFTICGCKSCGFQFTNPIPDKREIGRYYKSESYVSHTSSKKGLINKLYHVVRSYSLRKKVKLITQLNQGKPGFLIDYGAGTGHFFSKAILNGWSGLGLELDEETRNLAKQINTVDLKPIDDLTILGSNSADIITMWHVLEHVHEVDKTLSALIGALKNNGKLVVAVPNRNSYDAKYYKEYWAAYDVPIHLYHFVEEDLIKLLSKYNMILVKTLPMKFDSFYVSMLSEKYKKGNLIRAFFVGLLSNLRAKNNNYSSKVYIFELKN